MMSTCSPVIILSIVSKDALVCPRSNLPQYRELNPHNSAACSWVQRFLVRILYKFFDNLSRNNLLPPICFHRIGGVDCRTGTIIPFADFFSRTSFFNRRFLKYEKAPAFWSAPFGHLIYGADSLPPHRPALPATRPSEGAPQPGGYPAFEIAL